jgi:K+-sensing histidine kinase KdpD
MTPRPLSADANGLMVTAIFGAAIVGIAGLLSTVRDRVGSANAVLVLVVLVVGAAALGGRLAGATNAVIAALSFDFFLTAPHYSLDIASSRDIETFVLLLVIGLIVSELMVRRERIRLDASRTTALLDGLLDVGEQVSRGASVAETWTTAEHALVHGLGLLDCRYEPDGESLSPLPEITVDELVPRTRRFSGRGWDLPLEGAALPVAFGDHRIGRIVLAPGIRRGVTIEERRVAIAIAAQIAICLTVPRARDLH